MALPFYFSQTIYIQKGGDYLTPEHRLANAVIIQAAKDYRIALCAGNKSRVMELESFFKVNDLQYLQILIDLC